MKVRHCIKWGCEGIMRPTRNMWDAGGNIPAPTHRMFKCTVCGNENPWLDKPKLDGSFGELHKTPGGDCSGLSLMSDPVFYPPKNPIILNRPRRPRR